MAAIEAGIIYKVERFNGKNLSLCRRCVEAIFEEKGLQIYLERDADDIKPADVLERKKTCTFLLTL